MRVVVRSGIQSNSPLRIAICARARALAVSTHQLDELLVAHLPVFIALDEG